jgi:ABC-type multidrug transport system fused ATPase/permease subunit
VEVTVMDIATLSWPVSRLGEGMEELLRQAGLRPSAGEALAVPEAARANANDLDRWIAWASERLGFEAKPLDANAGSLDALLLQAGPSLLHFHDGREQRFLLLLASRHGMPRVLAPDLRVRTYPLHDLRHAVLAPHEAALMPDVARLLDVADLAPGRAARVGSALARERLGSKTIAKCWMLRVPATAPFWRQVRHACVPHKLAAMLGLFAVVYVLEILGWSIIGEAALNGRLDLGWLGAWALLLVSIVPLRLLGSWFDSALALDTGRLIKTRLLAGALKLDVEAVRREGVGQLLGRVMDSQAFEALALNSGLGMFVALVELAFAAWVLSLGAGGALHVVLLLLWLLASAALGIRYFRRLRAWSAMRLDMTHELVERMVGHRTTLVQESPTRRDLGEDQTIKDYLNSSMGMDRAILPFQSGVPIGWTLLGLVGLAPAFISGSATPAALAVGLGGVVLANRAFGGVASGLSAAARAAIAWKEVAPLFAAASKTTPLRPFVPSPQLQPQLRRGAGRLIDADGITYRYDGQTEPALKDASLTIHHGDRILIEGGSGGGKSTLASLLVGLREPDSGLLLLNGLDRHTLGDAWHRFATEAPQFHENHILNGTLAFNLLMGRGWPASDADIEEARELCVELGLGDLIARMPSGMMQTVGETGWQLSHGERSRVFLARALLQDAQLTILDESFAALDPETLQKCLDCAFRRAKTLAVIAHP